MVLALPFPLLLLMLNLIATWFMVGLIWVIQVVHYAMFDGVGTEGFIAYQKRHQFLITFVVGPPMLLEAVSSVLLFWYPPPGVSIATVVAGIVLLALIWGSTAVLQVPCHTKLLDGFEAAIHRRLVRSNWIRTLAWTARGAVVIWMLWQTLLANAGA